MDALLDTIARSSLVVLVALGVAAVLRRRSAALRHWVLATGIACSAAVPALQVALPAWNVSSLSSLAGRAGRADDAQAAAVETTIRLPGTADQGSATRTPDAAGGRAGRFPVGAMLAGTWLAGALISLSLLAVALSRASRLAAAARPLSSERVAAIAAGIAADLGLRRPVVLLESGEAMGPITWGAARPRIVLPDGATSWPDARVRVVLQHELAHVARGDWPAQMLAETVRAAYWFNPVYWIACRRMRAESERACDDTVLAAGVKAADYAVHLLEIARSAASCPPRAVIAMARPTSLEGRVSAMLNMTVSRRPLGDLARIATLVVFAAGTVPVAVAQARFSSFSGTVFDQTNRRLPGAVLVLANESTRAKYEVTTDASGLFEFVALPAGDYDLAVQLPGFKTLKERVRVAGTDVTRNFQLQIGSLQETVIVAASGRPGAPSPEMLERNRQRVERARRLASERCTGAPAADPGGGDVAVVGGTIIPPVKVTDVKPAYPEALRATGEAGAVVLEAVVGIDGMVRDVTVVSSPHPELERAAVDAVQRWEFTPTYLNCTPVEVSMQVTVTFNAR